MHYAKTKKLNRQMIVICILGIIIVWLMTIIFIGAFALPDDGINTMKKNEPEIKFNTQLIDTGVLKKSLEIAQPTATPEIQTMEVVNTQHRESIINTKVNSFVTSKTLHSTDIVAVKPIYDSDGKLFISSRSESMCLDIRTPSNWTEDDFYSILNQEMYDLVPVAIRLEKELGINAVYIIAVGANETGWGKYMAGKYNYFNWTNDAVYHFDFASIEEFSDFSLDTYREYYTDNSFYEAKLGFIPEHITPEVVNVKYALNKDNTTNWQWSNVVSEIMSDLCARRK